MKLFRNALLAIVLLASAAYAEDVDRFKRLGADMICTCSCMQALNECTMVGCGFRPPMQAELKKMIDEGKTDEQIKASFVAKYGTTVLIVPGTHGFDLTAWLMPFVALITGVLVVVFIVHKWRGQAAEATASGPVDVKFQDRVEEELKKFSPED